MSQHIKSSLDPTSNLKREKKKDSLEVIDLVEELQREKEKKGCGRGEFSHLEILRRPRSSMKRMRDLTCM